jgi:hypothetical protein
MVNMVSYFVVIIFFSADDSGRTAECMNYLLSLKH